MHTQHRPGGHTPLHRNNCNDNRNDNENENPNMILQPPRAVANAARETAVGRQGSQQQSTSETYASAGGAGTPLVKPTRSAFNSPESLQQKNSTAKSRRSVHHSLSGISPVVFNPNLSGHSSSERPPYIGKQPQKLQNGLDDDSYNEEDSSFLLDTPLKGATRPSDPYGRNMDSDGSLSYSPTTGRTAILPPNTAQFSPEVSYSKNMNSPVGNVRPVGKTPIPRTVSTPMKHPRSAPEVINCGTPLKNLKRPSLSFSDRLFNRSSKNLVAPTPLADKTKKSIFGNLLFTKEKNGGTRRNTKDIPSGHEPLDEELENKMESDENIVSAMETSLEDSEHIGDKSNQVYPVDTARDESISLVNNKSSLKRNLDALSECDEEMTNGRMDVNRASHEFTSGSPLAKIPIITGKSRLDIVVNNRRDRTSPTDGIGQDAMSKTQLRVQKRLASNQEGESPISKKNRIPVVVTTNNRSIPYMNNDFNEEKDLKISKLTNIVSNRTTSVFNATTPQLDFSNIKKHTSKKMQATYDPKFIYENEDLDSDNIKLGSEDSIGSQEALNNFLEATRDEQNNPLNPAMSHPGDGIPYVVDSEYETDPKGNSFTSNTSAGHRLVNFKAHIKRRMVNPTNPGAPMSTPDSRSGDSTVVDDTEDMGHRTNRGSNTSSNQRQQETSWPTDTGTCSETSSMPNSPSIEELKPRILDFSAAFASNGAPGQTHPLSPLQHDLDSPSLGSASRKTFIYHDTVVQRGNESNRVNNAQYVSHDQSYNHRYEYQDNDDGDDDDTENLSNMVHVARNEELGPIVRVEPPIDENEDDDIGSLPHQFNTVTSQYMQDPVTINMHGSVSGGDNNGYYNEDLQDDGLKFKGSYNNGTVSRDTTYANLDSIANEDHVQYLDENDDDNDVVDLIHGDEEDLDEDEDEEDDQDDEKLAAATAVAFAAASAVRLNGSRSYRDPQNNQCPRTDELNSESVADMSVAGSGGLSRFNAIGSDGNPKTDDAMHDMINKMQHNLRVYSSSTGEDLPLPQTLADSTLNNNPNDNEGNSRNRPSHNGTPHISHIPLPTSTSMMSISSGPSSHTSTAMHSRQHSGSYSSALPKPGQLSKTNLRPAITTRIPISTSLTSLVSRTLGARSRQTSMPPPNSRQTNSATATTGNSTMRRRSSSAYMRSMKVQKILLDDAYQQLTPRLLNTLHSGAGFRSVFNEQNNNQSGNSLYSSRQLSSDPDLYMSEGSYHSTGNNNMFEEIHNLSSDKLDEEMDSFFMDLPNSSNESINGVDIDNGIANDLKTAINGGHPDYAESKINEHEFHSEGNEIDEEEDAIEIEAKLDEILNASGILSEIPSHEKNDESIIAGRGVNSRKNSDNNYESGNMRSKFLETVSALSNNNGNIDNYLDSKFRLLCVLGHGSFADVYLAEEKCSTNDTTRAKQFAIKCSKHKFMGSRDGFSQMQEVEVMWNLGQHKNIIKLEESWIQSGHLYIQLEFCENGNLNDYISSRVSEQLEGQPGANGIESMAYGLPQSEVREILIQLARGLEHMHAHHIVHLDLKPDNIFVGNDGQLKIGDFGIATIAPVPRSRDHEGDRTYIAPEVLNGSSGYSTPADIFSLGLIILEIAGNFDLPQHGSKYQKLRQGDLSVADNLDSRCTPELIDLIKQMINPAPTLRPTAKDILLALGV